MSLTPAFQPMATHHQPQGRNIGCYLSSLSGEILLKHNLNLTFYFKVQNSSQTCLMST